MTTTTMDLARGEKRYIDEFPTDGPSWTAAFKVLESYSGIPKDQIEAHVREIRDKAFAIHNYPCLGRWRFLDMYLTRRPEYASIITRLKAGDSFLDVGCCFGQVLRQLAFDGAPAARLAGTDLRREFIDLGYDLFRDDPARFPAKFAAGDIFDPDDASLKTLDGGYDVIHAASFFHLFSWDEQVRVGERMVRFLRPGAKGMVLGRQVGTREPATDAGGRYVHDVESFQKLWDTIGDKTGTKWKVTGQVRDSEAVWVSKALLEFTVTQVL